MDQILDEEKRRKKRKDFIPKQELGRNISRSYADESSKYWQASHLRTNTSSSLAHFSGQTSDKSVQSRIQFKNSTKLSSPSRSPTVCRSAKSYLDENYTRPTAVRIRAESFYDRNFTENQNHRSQLAKNSSCVYNSEYRKNASSTQHVHKRNSNNDCKICTAYHPSNPRCYQVNYVLQDPDDVVLPWKKVAKDQGKLGTTLFIDNCQQCLHDDSNFSPIHKPIDCDAERRSKNTRGNN